MPGEALSLLNVRPDGTYLDATAGLAGHTRLIAERLTSGMVVANDRDPRSIEMARQNTAELSARIRFVHGSFGRLPESLEAAGVSEVDGLLAEARQMDIAIDDVLDLVRGRDEARRREESEGRVKL